MKRHGWGVLAFVISLLTAVPAGALNTVPTAPNKTSGPFLITSYSFSGSAIRYVQIYNSSTSLASLDGWQIASSTKTSPPVTTQYLKLTGLLEPGRHIFAAAPSVVDRSTFDLPSVVSSSTPTLGTVSLVAPTASLFNDELVTVPTISSSTIKELDGTYINYYLRRDISLTTGNYISGFSFMQPTERLKNDTLYQSPLQSELQIAELFPDSRICGPFDSAPSCSDYVKVLNSSTSPIDLSLYRIRTGSSGQAQSSTNTRNMSGILPSGAYISFPLSLSATGSWVWLEDEYGTTKYETTTVQYPSSAGYDNQAWVYDDISGKWGWTSMIGPSNIPSKMPVVPPVNSCLGLSISEIAANVASEDQYIEIMNGSNEQIDLTGCVLQTNRSASVKYLFPEIKLDSGAYLATYIKDTLLTMTKTTSGSIYLLSSDSLNEVDSVEYENLPEATAYARVGNEWLQTYRQTPGSYNVTMDYPACAIGSVRNIDTGLCNKISAATSVFNECDEGKYRSAETNRCRSPESIATLAPCDSGQVRSSETNRCRSIVTTASLLSPCAPGQVRNPDTNRCRSVGSSDELQPCLSTQERNPETNRCRNISNTVASDFPVETVTKSAEATVGWWAFGGVGTLAAGYAGWEWRRELMGYIKRVGRFGISRP